MNSSILTWIIKQLRIDKLPVYLKINCNLNLPVQRTKTTLMGKHSKKISNFIKLTYKIIEQEGNASTIHWIQQGTEFQITNIADFEQNILPTHFRHSKMSSFIRQLNMYGFSKKRYQINRFVFKNPFFVEGRYDLLHQITRKLKNKNRRKSTVKTVTISHSQKQNSSTSLKIQQYEPCSIDIWDCQHESYRLTSQQLINASSLSFNLDRKTDRNALMLSKSILQFQKIGQQKFKDKAQDSLYCESESQEDCPSIDQYLQGLHASPSSDYI